MERTHRTLELAHAPRTSGPATAADAGGPAARPVTAAPARIATPQRLALRERRVVLPDDSGPAAHAYRMLRTQLLRQLRTHKLKMIGVVSAADGEGKTLTAANLSLALAAEPNQTALLVDLDLRRPGVAQLLDLECTRGLESWFNGSANLADLFVGIEGIERLRILPTSQAVAGSSELLAQDRTRELLAELKNRYSDRVVIIDLPPALLADDFLTVATQLDGVLVVVSEGRTRREDLGRLKEVLGGVHVIGTVLNRSAEAERRAY